MFGPDLIDFVMNLLSDMYTKRQGDSNGGLYTSNRNRVMIVGMYVTVFSGTSLLFLSTTTISSCDDCVGEQSSGKTVTAATDC